MNNNANTNIVHIQAIEGLAMQINDHLDALTEDTVEKYNIKLNTMKAMADWQAIALYSLRRAYE